MIIIWHIFPFSHVHQFIRLIKKNSWEKNSFVVKNKKKIVHETLRSAFSFYCNWLYEMRLFANIKKNVSPCQMWISFYLILFLLEAHPSHIFIFFCFFILWIITNLLLLSFIFYSRKERSIFVFKIYYIKNKEINNDYTWQHEHKKKLEIKVLSSFYSVKYSFVPTLILIPKLSC